MIVKSQALNRLFFGCASLLKESRRDSRKDVTLLRLPRTTGHKIGPDRVRCTTCKV